MADLHVKTLEEILARQAEQVASLQTRLDEAIEGASGARALAHVNQIAMEQARTRPPQG